MSICHSRSVDTVDSTDIRIGEHIYKEEYLSEKSTLQIGCPQHTYKCIIICISFVIWLIV